MATTTTPYYGMDSYDGNQAVDKTRKAIQSTMLCEIRNLTQRYPEARNQSVIDNLFADLFANVVEAL